MKTVALIIAEKVFRDEEYQIPKEILEKAGIKIITVSTTLGKAIGKLGMEVIPDMLLEKIFPQDIDALIFIGGGGSSQYFDDVVAHRLAQDCYASGKVVGAICIAPVILANAGILRGKKATVFPDGKEQLQLQGAQYTEKEVEIDGRILTGSGPDAAEKFGKELLRLLG